MAAPVAVAGHGAAGPRQIGGSGNAQYASRLIAEIANTIIIGGGILVWAALSRRADVTVLAIAVGILFAVAWTASLLLRRGMAAGTATTTAFVEVSILRRKRSLQAIWVQAVLYVAILVFDLVWLFHYRGESSVSEFLMRPAVLVFLLIVTPLVAAAAMWYRRRLLELRSLRSVRL